MSMPLSAGLCISIVSDHIYTYTDGEREREREREEATKVQLKGKKEPRLKDFNSPNLPLLGRRHGHGLRDQIIIRHDAGAGLQRRDRRPQDLDHVRVGPVVEDVAEQVHVGRFHGLREEEVVRHEFDPVGYVGGDGVLGRADHVREFLDDEVKVGVCLGEGDADVAAGAADVDYDALFSAVIVVVVVVVVVGMVGNGGPGVAFAQEAGREADAVGQGGHGAREAFGHVRVRGVVLPDGHIGALGQAPAGLVGLVAAELLHRFDGVREGLPDLVEHVAEAGLGVGVFGELARGGRVGDVAFAGLLEDAVVGYGEADDAAEVRFRQAAFRRKVGEGDFAADGDVGGDVVLVYGL